MELTEKSFKLRTVKREEIANYFLKFGGSIQKNEILYGDGWEVEIGQETTAPLGSFMIPEIQITIRAEKEICNKLYADFKMAFLRAGG